MRGARSGRCRDRRDGHRRKFTAVTGAGYGAAAALSGRARAIASPIGVSPFSRSKVTPAVAGSASTATTVAATSVAGHLGPAPLERQPDRDQAGARVVGEPPGRTIVWARRGGAQRLVGLALGLVVRLHLLRIVLAVDAHRAHHHVAIDPGALAGLDQLHGGAESTVRLRAAPLPGPGARREDDRVGALDGAASASVDSASRSSTTASAPTASRSAAWAGSDHAAGESPRSASSREQERDLPVAAGDEDVHECTVASELRPALGEAARMQWR